MATSRDLINREQLEPFRDFIVDHGWAIEPAVGQYEILRARHPRWDKPLLVYFNSKNDDLTTAGVAFYWGLMYKNMLKSNHN